MGGVNTTLISATQVQNDINDVFTQSIESCTSGTGTSQDVTINATGNSVVSNLLISQSVTDNISCVASNLTQTDISNQLSTKLAATANSSSGIFGGFGFNTGAISTADTQTIVNATLVQNISTCNATNNWNQTIDVNASDYAQVMGVTIMQVGDSALNCVFNDTNMTTLSNNIASQMNDAATANGTGKGTSTIVYILLAVLGGLVVIGILASILFPKKKPVTQNLLYPPPPAPYTHVPSLVGSGATGDMMSPPPPPPLPPPGPLM